MERLEDRLALLDLSYAYARAADRREPETLAALFVDDGVLRIIRRGSESPPAERLGHQQIVDAIGRLVRYDATFHLVGNHRYELSADDDTATGEVYCEAHHLHGAAPDTRDRVMMIRYQDRYVRTAAGWRIAERELHVDWIDDRPMTHADG